MKKSFILFTIVFFLFSCRNYQNNKHQTQNLIRGTWTLISATTIQGDSLHYDDLSGKEMIKIIGDSHFAFLNHDLKKGLDSSLVHFVSGGGKYTVTNNTYTEFLDYCNYRQWEGHKFDFTIEFEGDTLIQSGIEKIEELGVDRKIIEKYLRLKS